MASPSFFHPSGMSILTGRFLFITFDMPYLKWSPAELVNCVVKSFGVVPELDWCVYPPHDRMWS